MSTGIVSEAAGRSYSAADRLILEAATGLRELSDAELLQVLEHVAQAGFDPHATETVRGRAAGLIWQGRVLRGSDRLPPAEVHYLRHVVAAQEWPAGVSLDAWLGSIAEVVLDPRSGVLVNRYQGE